MRSGRTRQKCQVRCQTERLSPLPGPARPPLEALEVPGVVVRRGRTVERCRARHVVPPQAVRPIPQPESRRPTARATWRTRTGCPPDPPVFRGPTRDVRCSRSCGELLRDTMPVVGQESPVEARLARVRIQPSTWRDTRMPVGGPIRYRRRAGRAGAPRKPNFHRRQGDPRRGRPPGTGPGRFGPWCERLTRSWPETTGRSVHMDPGDTPSASLVSDMPSITTSQLHSPLTSPAVRSIT